MKNHQRTTLSLLLLAGLAFSTQACLQQESTGDATQGEISRQNQAANAVESELDKIVDRQNDDPSHSHLGDHVGQFVGEYRNSEILLTLEIVRVPSSGNGDLSLVGQPILSGSLDFTPKIFVNNGGSPMTIPYVVNGGQYATGNDLSLTVIENGGQTTLHCKIWDNNLDILHCNWYVHASATPVANFTLHRLGEGQVVEAQSKKYGGTYVGSNADYKEIKAQFETVLEPQPGSLAIPQVSITGNFTFNGVSFSFKDSEYDPVTNTIAININGDNPIVVNCTVQSEASLHCQWVGTHGSTSYETFDLHKAP